MAYWLLKTEPQLFGWSHLIASPQQKTVWDGIRNYQARNFLRAMAVGDQAFFYHSRVTVPSIVGVVVVTQAAFADASAQDPASRYYDPSADLGRWSAVEVKAERALAQPVSLPRLRTLAAWQHTLLLRKGNRLSVVPLMPDAWQEALLIGGS